MGILIKIMNLVFCNKEYRVFENFVFIEIDKMFAFAPFEPNYLVEAMNMGPRSIFFILYYIFV